MPELGQQWKKAAIGISVLAVLLGIWLGYRQPHPSPPKTLSKPFLGETEWARSEPPNSNVTEIRVPVSPELNAIDIVIVNSSGSPVPNAMVAQAGTTEEFLKGDLFSTQADTSGEVTLNVEPGNPLPWLLLSALGYVTAIVSPADGVWTTEYVPGEVVKLVLSESVDLKVQVRDLRNRPIMGANVVALAPWGAEVRDKGSELVRGVLCPSNRTDATGFCELELSDSLHYTARISAWGYDDVEHDLSEDELESMTLTVFLPAVYVAGLQLPEYTDGHRQTSGYISSHRFLMGGNKSPLHANRSLLTDQLEKRLAVSDVLWFMTREPDDGFNDIPRLRIGITPFGNVEPFVEDIPARPMSEFGEADIVRIDREPLESGIVDVCFESTWVEGKGAIGPWGIKSMEFEGHGIREKSAEVVKLASDGKTRYRFRVPKGRYMVKSFARTVGAFVDEEEFDTIETEAHFGEASEVVINYDRSRTAAVRVEVVDSLGREVSNFELAVRAVSGGESGRWMSVVTTDGYLRLPSGTFEVRVRSIGYVVSGPVKFRAIRGEEVIARVVVEPKKRRI